MQYTASSFAQMLVGLFGPILRPRTHRPCQAGMFPARTAFESHVDDVVLDGQILPLARATERWLAKCRGLQQGLSQHYILYILLSVVALLTWIMPIERLIVRMFAR
jgi:hydrogenase-4 component B